MAEPFVEQDTTPGGGPTGWREENPQVFDYLCNLSLASNLKGKLLLIHGEPAQVQVMKMVRALIEANKFFDLLAIPDPDHVFTETNERYRQEAIRRYFQEHLKP